jgi:hypothetical protein
MTLAVPNYLRAARIQDKSLRYEWDDWRALPALEVIDEALTSRLKKVSQRAVLAFMCGTAEWIYHRLAKLCDDPTPANYLEGAWAMIIDARYCGCGSGTSWQEFAVKGWKGPIKRPIEKALTRLEVAIQQLAWEDTDPVRRAGLIVTLATYVMPDVAPYKQWCDQELERFRLLYPRNPQDQLGDVVPRQAVDPELDFKVDQTEALINKFLASLDYRSNPFLSSPEGMLEEGFPGKPYVFDMEADRHLRLNPEEEEEEEDLEEDEDEE